jgi:hypothetical protein
MNRIVVLFVLLLFSFSSCNEIPFFISKEKEVKRQEKKISRLEKKRKKAQYKLDLAKGSGKRKIKKLEKIEAKLPTDTVVIGLDSASLASEKKEIETVSLQKATQEIAKNIIKENNIQFKTAKIKTKMKFISGSQKQSFNAQFRIEYNKTIWVDISGLGISVGRALLTPNRVQVINRVNKVYYDYSFAEIKELINVELDFMTLQDIIIGNAIGGNGEVFEFSDFGGTYNIGLRDTEFLNKLTYNKSDSTLRQIQLQVFRGSYASNILGMLGEYQKQLGRLVSTKRVFNIEDSKGKLSLEMNIQKVDFDGEYRMPYNVPASYQSAEEAKKEE